MRISDWSSDVCSSDLRLYVDGDAERGLVACAACHGFAGEGIGPANPPLGGQPAAYLAEQLEAWRRSERRNDPGNVMLRISRRLNPREVAALAAYAASLPGGLPRQESRAASPEAHRADSRRSEEHTSELQSLMPISYAV